MSAPAPERGRADRGAAADHLPADAQVRRLHALAWHHELPRPDRERPGRERRPARPRYVLPAVPRRAEGLPEVHDRGGEVHAAWVTAGSASGPEDVAEVAVVLHAVYWDQEGLVTVVRSMGGAGRHDE